MQRWRLVTTQASCKSQTSPQLNDDDKAVDKKSVPESRLSEAETTIVARPNVKTPVRPVSSIDESPTKIQDGEPLAEAAGERTVHIVGGVLKTLGRMLEGGGGG